MSADRFVSYLRLGIHGGDAPDVALAAQSRAVAGHLGRSGQLVAETRETEPAPGGERPELRKALALCRLHDATLLVAELGALSRDAIFLSGLCRELRRQNLHVVAADMPEANEVTVGIMAAVAEAEARLGADRDAATLARRRAFYARFTAERRAGVRRAGPADEEGARPLAESLGRSAPSPRSREMARDVAPLLGEIRAAGALTLEQVANALNALGIPSARGNRWYPMQVTRIEKRLAAAG